MQAGRFDVKINQPDTLPGAGEQGCQVGGQAGFAGAAAKGMDHNDGRHICHGFQAKMRATTFLSSLVMEWLGYWATKMPALARVIISSEWGKMAATSAL